MFEISNKPVGDGNRTYITFEAGPTHDGFDTAKRLIEEAADAGADAVKFQLLDPDRLVSDKKQMFSYHILKGNSSEELQAVSEPLYDILCRRCMSRDEWYEIKAFCDRLGVTFFATATFEDEIEFLVGLGVDTIKICSGDVDCFPIIRTCAKKGLCIQIDTGNATIGEVERAVDVALEEGCDRIVIHNCPSGYPARLESINLRIIPTLKSMFGFPIAFSDHTAGWEMDIAAVALGANMVEKTITLDRTIRSPEHSFSLEPADMRAFVKSIRDLEKALGSTRRVMPADERTKAMAVRRSIVLSRDVKSNESVTEDALTYARPGVGLRPELGEMLLGRRFSKALRKGHMLRLADIL